MTTHELKTWPECFVEIWEGRKTFELCKNDRDFQPGDELVLREYDPSAGTYSGRKITAKIGYVLKGDPRIGAQTAILSLLKPRNVDAPRCGVRVRYDIGCEEPAYRGNLCKKHLGEHIHRIQENIDLLRQELDRLADP